VALGESTNKASRCRTHTHGALSGGVTVRCELGTLATGLSVSKTADTCSECQMRTDECRGGS